MRYPSLLALLIGSLLMARAERLPVEDFSHEDAFSGLALSPDGKVVVYNESIKGDNKLFIRDIATGKQLGIDLEGFDPALVHQTDFFWANNQRLVFSSNGRYAAIDRDGTHSIYRLPGEDLLFLFRDEAEGMMLMNVYEIATGAGMRRVQYYKPERPMILKVYPRTGNRMREVENPGNVVAWGVNPQGVTTVAVEIKGTEYRAVYRANADAAWETLPGMDWTDPQVRPVGFSASGQTLYVTRITPAGTWGIYPYNLAQRKLGEPLLANERYDIIPGHGRAYANDLLYQMPLYSPKERELLGFRYLTDFPRTLWLDPALAQMQEALDHALPEKINTVVSLSDDLQRMMVLSWTASDPGTFYFFDRQAQKLEKLVARMPWINPAKMADVLPVRFKARDGLMINGYLTVPKGREPKHLPLVVMPHENPWIRDTWSFNPTAQFLANRGYAVLQVNFRGSSGYGEDFRNSGRRQIGGKMPQDVADGVRWAIRQNLADPARVGIVGFNSHGGAAALMGLALDPDLYCCGAASFPYTDWVKVIDKTEMDPDAYTYYTEWMGNPETNPAELRAISPLNLANQIKAPVLLIHNSEDDDWSFNQTKDMAAALKKAGREVEFKTKYKDLRYGYERRARWLGEIEAFLAQHMPADAVAAPALAK
jgi:dipeptidyl aminopeptidase/acylaminoacyl peptidase